MLIGGKNFASHVGWLIAISLVAIAAICWYAMASWNSPRLPGGGSLPGLTFGVLGGAIILFEFALWPRRKVRAWRIGSAQTWLRAHIWLGLLTAPLLLMHSGMRLGGSLSTALSMVLVLVIASGIVGLGLQQFVPRMIFDRVPAETIYAQIGHVARQHCDEAERLVIATCGPAARGDDPDSTMPTDFDESSYVLIGALRAVQKVQGKVLQTVSTTAPVANTAVLRENFYATIRPYLLEGSAGGSALRRPHEAARFFRGLRKTTDAAAHATIDALESLCEQRRQFDVQSRLYFLLHAWLWVHLPMSIALILLMFVHIVVALRYW